MIWKALIKSGRGLFKPSRKAFHPLLLGPNVGLWPVGWRDARKWLAARRDNRDYLAPWEPAWPIDALSRRRFWQNFWQMRQDWRTDRSYSFLIFSRDRQQLYGGISLIDVQRSAAQKATIGYWMGADWQGRGLMIEALGLLCDYSFAVLQFHRLEAASLPANIASRRVLERCGFLAEGLARQYLQINHQWHDHVLYARIHPDYSPSLARWVGGI